MGMKRGVHSQADYSVIKYRLQSILQSVTETVKLSFCSKVMFISTHSAHLLTHLLGIRAGTKKVKAGHRTGIFTVADHKITVLGSND